jgi:sentrin-specific protease 7
MDGILDGSIPGCFTLLQCRTVRIGSYKVVPKDRVLLSSVGIRIAVPAIEDGKCMRAIFMSQIFYWF